MADIPFDQRDGVIWLNGALLPWAEARIHVLSHGLHYASCVFEGERLYGGRIFKLEEHTARLFESASILGFELPFGETVINQACRDVVKENGLRNGYIRPFAWRGSEQMGVSAQLTKINVAIAAWDWGAYYDPSQRMKGIRLKLADYRRPDPQTAPVRSKAAGLYMICTLEKHKAEAEGFHDALMLDWRGQVAEATGANVFFVKGDVIHTPTPDCFLDGITRRTVIDLARKNNFEVVERAIMPDEMLYFQECFITGTAAEVTPVAQIGPYKFQPGDITKTLLDDYTALVNPDAAEAKTAAS